MSIIKVEKGVVENSRNYSYNLNILNTFFMGNLTIFKKMKNEKLENRWLQKIYTIVVNIVLYIRSTELHLHDSFFFRVVSVVEMENNFGV